MWARMRGSTRSLRATEGSNAPVFNGRRPTADGRRPTADAVAEKYLVYTARYRHTLKGPDRGKWESSIVAEADAPLLSIESVVRGVQRRSGDVDPPDHMSAAELRAALRLEGDGGA